MFQDGLMNEVARLEPHKNLKALQTVGYSEIFEHLAGRVSLKEAVDKIKQHTRNYAKRQITYFNNRFSIEWIEPEHWAAYIRKFAK
jgi:tRNA dimethylallyltransferase